jgi:cytidylate kinase
MIVLVAGVAGSGKTTTGELLARQLGWESEIPFPPNTPSW